MSWWVKALAVLALVVPMTAYVAGSLVSSRSYDPSDRTPVIIQDAPAADPSTQPTTSPTRPPPGRRDGEQPLPDDGEDNDPTVVVPAPTPVDDDDGDDDDDGPEEDGPAEDDDDDEADDRDD